MRIVSVGGAGSAAATGRRSAGAADGPLAPADDGAAVCPPQASAAHAHSTRPARAYRPLGDVISAAPPHRVGRGKFWPLLHRVGRRKASSSVSCSVCGASCVAGPAATEGRRAALRLITNRQLTILRTRLDA